MSNNAPEIRFKGFTDAWVQRKLGEVSDFSKGNGYSKNDLIKSGIPIILYGRLYTKYETIISQVDTFVNEKSASVYSCGGEVIVPASGETAEDISRASVVENSGILLGGDLNIIAPYKGLEPTFLALNITNGRPHKEMSKLAQGKSVVHLHNSDLEKIDLLYPSYMEQAVIGTFFKSLDETITLHKRKLDGLKKLKTGYLQQMFPQTGESVPRVRFDGFHSKWKERELGALFTERSERSAVGELISVTINAGVVKASSLDRKDNSSEDKGNYKKVEIGDIAYNSMRMWQGASGISNYAGILSPAYTVIVPRCEVSSLFFSYVFKLTKMIQVFQASSQGLTSDTWNLKFPLLKNILVATPCYEEQIAVGNLFRKLDDSIAVETNKIAQLQRLKAAYLQKMFI